MVQGITFPPTLESQIEGQVIQPSDSHYDQSRLAWNRLVDQRPALIVVAANTADVSAAVRYARENDLSVAVQSTGHGVTVPADGALLLVTSQLKNLRIDAGAQTAWLGAGLQWGEVLEQTQAVGLAPLAGSSPTVSVTGYTLGGGYGWLGRKYGLAADSVLSFEMVDANGDVLQVSEDQHSDLFWGLRGGGGSFGVITSMQVRLYPVTQVYAGNLLYPAEQARQVLQHYREWVASAPDELTSSIALMNLPPLPEVPEFLRGKSIVMVRGCYAGDTPSGEKLLDHWRSWQAPMVDLWGEMPFTRMAEISTDPVEPMPSNHSGAFLKDLNDAAIDTLIQYAYPPGGPPPLVMVEARHFGGAVARLAPGTNAFSHRDSAFLLFAVTAAFTPEMYAAQTAHMDAMLNDLEPVLTGGVYLNFLEGPAARRKVKDGFSVETYQRLQALKARVDPQNRFRFGYHIPPTSQA
jgi:FAD/FMN-containing dehydrogenase